MVVQRWPGHHSSRSLLIVSLLSLILTLSLSVEDLGDFVKLNETIPLAADANDINGKPEDVYKWWSRCNCPANDAHYDSSQYSDTPTAKIAYLIVVHNRRTIRDGAYLLKSLIETSQPGDIAIILIHVDKRVGILSSKDNSKANNSTIDEKNTFLYDNSPMKMYVDACHSTPACARSSTTNSNKSNATILEVHSHFSPEWSKWSMNDPTIWAMDYLLHHSSFSQQHHQSWDVFINLSGDTVPVISAHRISKLFEPKSGPLGNTNFVTSSSCVTGLLPTSIYHFPKHWMKRGHYFQHNIPKKFTYVDLITAEWKKDVDIVVYFGSQWMALTHEFVNYVVRSLDHPNGLGNVLKDTLIKTGVLMTDETFFATMLMNSPSFNNTIPKVNADGALTSYPSLHSIRYERMDENLPGPWGKFRSSDPIYDIPPKFKDETDGEGAAKPWGPYFLGLYDLGAIRDSGALFVRKVSSAVDENMLHILPVVENLEENQLEWDILPDFRWPDLGVKIKDPFIWAWEKAKMKKNESLREE